MVCVDSLPGADAGRWARPSLSIVPKDREMEASAWGKLRLVHTSRRECRDALAAIHVFNSNPVGTRARSVGGNAPCPLRLPQPLPRFNIPCSGRQNGFGVFVPLVDAYLRGACRLGTVRDRWDGCKEDILSGGTPDRAGLEKTSRTRAFNRHAGG